MRALALSSGLATDPNLVQLDRVDSTDLVGIRSDHTRAQLMENLECRLVPTDPELALELHSRHARCETRNKVGTPEPRQQRRVTVLHDGASREPGFLAALPAAKHVRPSRNPNGINGFARRTNETVRPAYLLHVGGAGCIVRKELLELQETLGKR